MKLITSLSFLFLLCFHCTNAQSPTPPLNPGFEFVSTTNGLPDDWFQWGTPDYALQTDSTTVHSGKYALSIFPKREDPDPQSFGCAAFRIPAQYDGSRITLEGYMKIEDVENGPAGLLLRVDGDNGSIGFENMANENIQGTHDWKQYSISVKYSNKATTIFFGGLLSGTGKAWFDDFQLLIDGVPIEEVPVYEPPPVPADLDTEFDDGSRILIAGLSDFQHQALYRLGKIWGFAKYHHPRIAKGDINWDYELFRILPAVLETTDREALNKTFAEWISGLGKVKQRNKTDNAEGEVKLSPTTQWVSDEAENGEALSKRLQQMARAESPESHYYIGQVPNIQNPDFKNERSYPDLSFTDDGFKLLTLFRYWNMIEYWFPYKHLTDQPWDDVLHEFIPRILAANDELSYKLTTLDLIAHIQDTHANIWMQDSLLTAFHGARIIPLEVKIIEGKVVITRFFDHNLPIAYRLQPGDVVLQIGTQSTEEAITERLPYCPASNRPTQLRNVARRLLRTNSDSLSLMLETNDGLQTLRLPTVSHTDVNFWEKDNPAWKFLSDDIGYIYPGNFRNQDVDAMMDSFAHTKGIVIDLRCYPSEFIVFTLGKHFVPQPTEFVKFTRGSLDQPGAFTFGPPFPVGEENNTSHYKGKIAILVDETTQSQAEYTTMAFQSAPNARVFGSTTAGADGNVSEIKLPGNIRTMISGIGVYYPDGRETQRIGVKVDVEVKPTLKGVREGRDEVLEKALEWVNE